MTSNTMASIIGLVYRLNMATIRLSEYTSKILLASYSLLTHSDVSV